MALALTLVYLFHSREVLKAALMNTSASRWRKINVIKHVYVMGHFPIPLRSDRHRLPGWWLPSSQLPHRLSSRNCWKWRTMSLARVVPERTWHQRGSQPRWLLCWPKRYQTIANCAFFYTSKYPLSDHKSSHQHRTPLSRSAPQYFTVIPDSS